MLCKSSFVHLSSDSFLLPPAFSDIGTAKNINFNGFNGFLFDLKFPYPGTLGPYTF
jgi:hypothetical protein